MDLLKRIEKIENGFKKDFFLIFIGSIGLLFIFIWFVFEGEVILCGRVNLVIIILIWLEVEVSMMCWWY